MMDAGGLDLSHLLLEKMFLARLTTVGLIHYQRSTSCDEIAPIARGP